MWLNNICQKCATTIRLCHVTINYSTHGLDEPWYNLANLQTGCVVDREVPPVRGYDSTLSRRDFPKALAALSLPAGCRIFLQHRNDGHQELKDDDPT